MIPKKFRKFYLLAAILLIATVAAASTSAFVMYTQTLTLTPYKQCTLGTSSTASWTTYVNETDQNIYVPSGAAASDLDNANVTTYAFSVQTDASKVCAVKIELATALSSLDFSKFDIKVLVWTVGSPGSWSPATLYNAATGTITTSSLNGLNSEGAVYIHQAANTETTYYLVKITYAYNLFNTTSPYTVDVKYTPLPQNSF
jgi:hypothetical protein